MENLIHGIVHGKSIELSENPGVPDGTQVQLWLKPLAPAAAVWGEGLRRCAGALADEWTEDDDRILEEIHQERSQDSRRELDP